MAIIDASVTNTPVFIQNSNSTSSLAGSLVLNNIHLTNVPIAVKTLSDNGTVLQGTTSPGIPTTIHSWAQGNVYTGTSADFEFVKGPIPGPKKPAVLLEHNGSGRLFGRGHPQYEEYDVGEFVSAKSEGAKGDGKSDDTEVLQSVFDKVRLPLFFTPTTYNT